MGKFLDKIKAIIDGAKEAGGQGLTDTGQEPDEIIINPEVKVNEARRLSAREKLSKAGVKTFEPFPDDLVKRVNDTAKKAEELRTKLKESVDDHERHHTLFFGRVNPPHAGHEEAYKTVKNNVLRTGGTGSMVLSRTQDPKRNPLTPEQKLLHAKRAFPGTTVSLSDKKHPTMLGQLSKLHEKGVTHLHLVAGSDRLNEYKKLISKYNGKASDHGNFNFKSIKYISSGKRDPDSEGTEGVSASKQREHATNGDLKSFAKGAPSAMKSGHVKELFNDVKSGLKGK